MFIYVQFECKNGPHKLNYYQIQITLNGTNPTIYNFDILSKACMHIVVPHYHFHDVNYLLMDITILIIVVFYDAIGYIK